jgi:hypothetical protein
VTLAEHCLWMRLDLSSTSGVTCKVDDAAVRAAAARAGGRLEALDVAGMLVSNKVVLEVAAANASTLREVKHFGPGAQDWWQANATLERLLRAAPLLQRVEVDVCGYIADARRVLRNEPPFGPVRAKALSLWDVNRLRLPGEQTAETTDLLGLLGELTEQTSLAVDGVPIDIPQVLDALVDTVLACRLTSLYIGGNNTYFSPASVPALARLLGGSALAELIIAPCGERLLDEPAAQLLGGALRANSTLTSLMLNSVELWHDPAAAVVLLGALTAHPSLRVLDLTYNHPDGAAGEAAAFAALAALVAADAPALHDLDITNSSFRDEELGPLVDALSHNTHLRSLRYSCTCLTEAFMRNRLLPAARANSGLRELVAGEEEYELDGGAEAVEENERAHAVAAEAQALVAARAA